jgi:spermidine synthase
VQEDVAKVTREANDEFDAIMLDVDNGPSPQVDERNAWLYTDSGLKAIRRALRDGGRVAIWSAYEAPQFPAHMRRNGFRSDHHRIRAHKGHKGKGGTHHLVFTGWKT